MPSNAMHIAHYLLGNTPPTCRVDHLKLQKLLYYAQGFCLALQEEALFAEPLLRWDNGPVVRPVYNRYTGNGKRELPSPPEFDPDDYPPETRELLDAVLTTYGSYEAPVLWRLSHSEPPWLETPKNGTISHALIRPYFGILVEAGRNKITHEGHPILDTTEFKFQRRKQISGRMLRHRDRLRAIADTRPDGFNPWALEVSED